jgi:hypothetical protein
VAGINTHTTLGQTVLKINVVIHLKGQTHQKLILCYTSALSLEKNTVTLCTTSRKTVSGRLHGQKHALTKNYGIMATGQRKKDALNKNTILKA